MDKQYMQAGSTTVTAGGTAQSVTLGFTPAYIKVVNQNNTSSYEWFSGMSDDTSIDQAAALTVNAAGGLTPTTNGFTIGTDIADTTADVIRWVAFR